MPDSHRVPFLTDREDLPPEGRKHYDSIAASRGRIVAPYAVLLNSPEIAGRAAHLGAYIRFEGELSSVDRERAILTTARERECAFEWAAHVPIAEEAGVDAATIEGIADRVDPDAFEGTAGEVVAFCRELLRTDRIAEETYAPVHDRLGDSGVIELVATVGYYAMMACVLNAFEVSPHEDAPSFD